MKIRNKLTLLFAAIVAALMMAFALIVYLSFSENREEEYYKLLRRAATTKVNLLFDAKISPDVLQTIYKSSENALLEEETAIYDTSFNLLYHDAVEIDKVKETKEMIDNIISQRNIKFYQGETQVVGILYKHKDKNYVVTAAAYDQYGFAKLRNLKYTLIFALVVSLIIILIIGRFLSKQALKPVSDLVINVEEITATNLDLRVNEGKGKDEIAELAITFNRMLDRLEKSFDAQKEFVSNISHELRTPLTAMLAELQLIIEKDRTNEEYKRSIHHTISDAQKIVRLSNSLLDLAKANYDKTEINFKSVRLDEIILDARNEVVHNQPEHKVNILFEKDIEDDNSISINGNEYLLKVAFINLMENGCKYSDNKESTVLISYSQNKIKLLFQDKGIGIAEEDLPKLFTPFFRGKNTKSIDGNGIGLSLSKKIIALHKGEISVTSKVNEGTTFSVEFKHV